MRSSDRGCGQAAALLELPRVSGVGAPGKRGKSPKAAPPHGSPVLRPYPDPLPRSRCCRAGARQAAHTRRQRREQPPAKAQPQPAAESPAQAHVTRHSRPRAHADMLTVAIRGPLAARMRELSETTGMSLVRLLQDAILVYEGRKVGGSVKQM